MNLTDQDQPMNPKSGEISQHHFPFTGLAQDAVRRASYIKEAAWQILDLLQTSHTTHDTAAHQNVARTCHVIYHEMAELEEAMEQAL